MDDLLLTFYGDDFTGSTDVLESLASNGVRTVLFLELPEPSDLDAFAERDRPVEAVGVAGRSRTMSPGEMDEHLPPVFEALAEFGAELFHYKVCSTFDSSPEVGSIGHAIDIGRETFAGPFVPIVVAAPSLRPRGRYVVFGNHFATVDGRTHRLDRHPTMRDHPVTPMREADLTRHLAEQTDRSIGLLDVRSLDGKEGTELETDLDEVIDRGNEVVVFDGLNRVHQRKAGRLIWDRCTAADGQVFSASSSGLSYALTSHWQESGLVDDSRQAAAAGEVDQIAAVSGSASPVTRDQIEWALDHEFTGVRLDTAALIDPDQETAAREQAIEDAIDAIEAGESVVCYTAFGPDDPAIEKTCTLGAELGFETTEVGERIGSQQGRIARRLIEETGLDRLCIAGGDTSGYVAPHLDVYALEFLAPVGPGSPLCRGHSRHDDFRTLELALKGGQVQTTAEEANYFGAVRDGGHSD